MNCLWWSRGSCCCWETPSARTFTLSQQKVAALDKTLLWLHSDHVTLSLHCHWLPVTHPVYPFRWFIFHRRRATSSPSLFQSKVQPAASPCCHCQYCTDTASPLHHHCIHIASPLYPHCIPTAYHQSIYTASPLRHHCITTAYHHSIYTASTLRHHCITTMSIMYHHDIHAASPLHSHCILGLHHHSIHIESPLYHHCIITVSTMHVHSLTIQSSLFYKMFKIIQGSKLCSFRSRTNFRFTN